jgi:hypothetical protein
MGLLELANNSPDFFYYQSKGYVGGLGNFSAKKLPYTNDTPGGGTSNQPYIKTPIPDLFSTNPPVSKDFILRGGANATDNGYISTVEQNIKRINSFITDTKNPSFGLFLDKQKELYKQQSKLPGSILPARVYDPSNLYINIAAGSKGLHESGKGESVLPPLDLIAPIAPQLTSLALAGRLQGSLFDPVSSYGYQTQTVYNNVQIENPNASNSDLNFLQTTISNRLGLLWKSKIASQTLKAQEYVIANSFNIALLNPLNLFFYPEGPNGPLNVYHRATDTSAWSDNPGNIVQIGSPPQVGGAGAWFNVFTSKTLYKYSAENVFRNGPVLASKVKDFRQEIIKKQPQDPNSVASKVLSFTDYTKFNRINTYKMGDPGNTSLNRSNPYSMAPLGADNQPSKDVADQINLKPIYSSDNQPAQDLANADLVPFFISVINIDNPAKSNYIHFRAYLSGLTDTYTADWTEIKYMGRGEKFYTYGGFGRTMSLGFVIHANSKQEHKVMYQKLNYLASLLAPNYSSFNKTTTGFMRGNIIRLTIGDYLVEQPGIITGLGFSIDDQYSWDIGRTSTGEKDPDSLNLPHTINVTGFNFTPIHSFLPKTLSQEWIDKETGAVFDSPFINMGANQIGGLSANSLLVPNT